MSATSRLGGSTAVGDREAAFYDLYHRESAAVLRFLRATVGDLATAEDLCADSFCRAWDRWAAFSGDAAQARAWIFRIARNRLIDHLRHRGRLTVLSTEHTDPPVEGHETGSAARLDLQVALAALKPDDRALLGMRVAGLSLAEIGIVQGRSEEAVKKAWQRALTRIRDRWEVA